jgi:hypothetical protein
MSGEKDVHSCFLESAGTSDTTIKVNTNPGKKSLKLRYVAQGFGCNFRGNGGKKKTGTNQK